MSTEEESVCGYCGEQVALEDQLHDCLEYARLDGARKVREVALRVIAQSYGLTGDLSGVEMPGPWLSVARALDDAALRRIVEEGE